jgi:hypothetical protein
VSGISRTAIFALATVAGTVAVCMALPAVLPSCGMPADAGRTLGACAAAQTTTRELASIGLVTGGILGAVFLGSIGIHAALHHQISRSLGRRARPAVVAGHQVGLLPGRSAALVAGIRRPRIYCSDELAALLSPDELRAVLLHERHHELSHAPAKLVVLSALAPFLGWLEVGLGWLERRRAAIEIAADEHAIHNGASRATLARAILKLRETPSQVSLAGFAAAGDLRLRALLGEDIDPGTPSRRTIATAVVITVVVGILCSALPLL